MKRWLTPLLLCPGLAQAASLDASAFSPLWALPFVGMLLSIALVFNCVS